MRWAAAALPMLLAACSAERAPEAEPAPTPVPVAVSTEPRTMVAADLVAGELGGRLAGSEIADAPIGHARHPMARASGYVACPRAIARCDPAALPGGTRYSYVLTVTPAEAGASPPPPPGATPPPLPLVVPVAGALATLAPVPGFEGAVGYSLAEAAAALGAENAIGVTLEQGRIVWRVREGRRWLPGRPITIWWQSTRPPAGAMSKAYEFAAGSESAALAAPFPAADKPVERGQAR